MRHRIAVIPGDGIGRRSCRGMRVLEAAGGGSASTSSGKRFDWSCEVYARTGRMMPEDGLEQLRAFEAIFLGAVGFPGVADHVSLWGLLIPIRRGFHQYINLRPVRLLEGVRSPLAGRGPADIDMLVVRENNEGEYSRSAADSTAAPRRSWPSSSRCSRAGAATASCATPSSARWRAPGAT